MKGTLGKDKDTLGKDTVRRGNKNPTMGMFFFKQTTFTNLPSWLSCLYTIVVNRDYQDYP